MRIEHLPQSFDLPVRTLCFGTRPQPFLRLTILAYFHNLKLEVRGKISIALHGESMTAFETIRWVKEKD